MKFIDEETTARVYYRIKPFMSRKLQIQVRSMIARQKRKAHAAVWPIDQAAASRPAGFQGWPDQKRFSVVLAHDVITSRGLNRCAKLMALEQEAGFRSSFNFVADGYYLPPDLRHWLVAEGFEVGVHGPVDGARPCTSPQVFARHAAGINGYLKEWNAVGFRSHCAFRQCEMLSYLDISYDASSFDTDPFEAQFHGIGTIFPVHQTKVRGREYVELPYTLAQDFTLFVLFKEQDIGIWKEKLRWLAEHGGMALLITHPDYMAFDQDPEYDEYDPRLYRDLLTHISTQYQGQYWHPLPQEMAAFWRESVRP